MNPPKLGRFLGFGFAMYGRRAVDSESGSFVMTRCFSVLWAPLLAIGAYRVSYDDGKLTFLERERVSALAMLWNVLVIAAVLVFGGIVADEMIVSSPSWKARDQIRIAETLLQNEEEEAAAREFLVVLRNEWPLEDKALDGMNRAIRQLLNRGGYGNITDAIRLLDEFDLLRTSELRAEVIAVGASIAKEHASTNPKDALQLIDAIKNLSEGEGDLSEIEFGILKELARTDPQQLDQTLSIYSSAYRPELLPLISDQHPEMAREWTEQMFNNAKSIDKKVEAAVARADLAIDFEERLEWLAKTRLTDPKLAIEYHEGRASLAEGRGNNETAAAELRAALPRYAELPESGATFHGLGQIRLRLFDLTGEPEEEADALAAFERAFQLDSEDAGIRRDLASVAFDIATSDLLSAPFSNQEQLQTALAQAAEADGVIRAKSLLDAAEDPESLLAAGRMALVLRDIEWARQLLPRLEKQRGAFAGFTADLSPDAFAADYASVDEKLAKTIPAFRQIRAKTAETWNPRERVLWALWQPSLREAVLEIPEFQTVLGAERERFIRFPDRPTLPTWALFEKTAPAFAAQARPQADNPMSQLRAFIDLETGRSEFGAFLLDQLRGEAVAPGDQE